MISKDELLVAANHYLNLDIRGWEVSIYISVNQWQQYQGIIWVMVTTWYNIYLQIPWPKPPQPVVHSYNTHCLLFLWYYPCIIPAVCPLKCQVTKHWCPGHQQTYLTLTLTPQQCVICGHMLSWGYVFVWFSSTISWWKIKYKYLKASQQIWFLSLSLSKVNTCVTQHENFYSSNKQLKNGPQFHTK